MLYGGLLCIVYVFSPIDKKKKRGRKGSALRLRRHSGTPAVVGGSGKVPFRKRLPINPSRCVVAEYILSLKVVFVEEGVCTIEIEVESEDLGIRMFFVLCSD